MEEPFPSTVKVKVKFGQTRGVLWVWGSHISRQSILEGGKVVGPKHRPPLPLQEILLVNQRLSQLQDHNAAGRIKWMRNSSDTTRNRSRNLPAFSAMSQPNAPLRTPHPASMCKLERSYRLLERTTALWKRQKNTRALHRVSKMQILTIYCNSVILTSGYRIIRITWYNQTWVCSKPFFVGDSVRQTIVDHTSAHVLALISMEIVLTRSGAGYPDQTTLYPQSTPLCVSLFFKIKLCRPSPWSNFTQKRATPLPANF
jgi:hypothetical protein